MTTSLKITYRPIESWPGELTPNGKRKASPFSAGWIDTEAIMERELRFLQAKNIVFQVALREQDLRIDGSPKARAVSTHPGVILSFDSKHGPLQYPCDRFRDFQSNVRAIVLSLEALRRVDRYGVTKHAEQYKGWQQIGTGEKELHDFTYEQAEVWIRANSGLPDYVSLLAAYRGCARRMHPDVGGDPEVFKRLQNMWAIVNGG